MKKLLLTLIACVFAVGAAYAEIDISDVLEKIPNANIGIAYSILDETCKPIATTTIYKFDKLSVDIGATTKDSSVVLDEFTTLIGQVSYGLWDAKSWDKTADIPIVNLIELRPGAYVGYDRLGDGKGNNEFDYGLSITAISAKF